MDLKLADAKKIIEASLAAQASHNFKPMAVVVVGARGTIIAAEAQDGTSLLRPKIAHGKAYGAIALGVGSRVLFERAKNEAFFIQAANALSDGALSLCQVVYLSKTLREIQWVQWVLPVTFPIMMKFAL